MFYTKCSYKKKVSKLVTLLRIEMTHIILLDCKTNTPFLEVRSPSAKYKDPGIFYCTNDYNLINFTELSPNTECNKMALWENEKDFKCWKGFVLLVFNYYYNLKKYHLLNKNFEN